MGTICIDGEMYHTGSSIDEENSPLLDENGDPIPKHICLCCAYSPNECICGAWDLTIPEGLIYND